MLGHRKIDATSELYAPFDPAYMAEAVTEIEAIIGEIVARFTSLTPSGGHSAERAEKAAECCGKEMVGVARIELATSAMSTRADTPNLLMFSDFC